MITRSLLFRNCVQNRVLYSSRLNSSSWSESWMETYKGISESSPVKMMGESLVYIHEYSEFPWWSILSASGIALRFITTFPAHIMAQKTMAKRKILFTEFSRETLPELKRRIFLEGQAYGHPEGLLQNRLKEAVSIEIKKRVIENNCAASKMILPHLIQIPIWLTMTVAIRNQITPLVVDRSSMLKFAEFSSEGCLWFPNLIYPDSTMILPILMGFSLMLSQECTHGLYKPKEGMDKRHFFQKVALGASRCIPFIMIPICSFVPSGLNLYWTVSAFSGLCVNLILMQPAFRRTVNIPITSEEPQKPLKTIKNNLKNDFIKLKGVIKLK